MKKFSKKLIVPALVISFVLIAAGLVFTRPIAVRAFPNPATIDLGTSGNFALLAGTPNITDAGGASVIIGDVGLRPAAGSGIGLTCSQVTGTIYSVDATGPAPCVVQNDGLLNIAKIGLTAAYDDAAGRLADATVATELGGTTKTAGVYVSAATTFQITAGAGPLVLDGLGDSSSVFIFKMGFAGTGLTVGPGSVVSLINGAQAKNVFWQVDTATIDTTAVFKGNILALTSITVANSANIQGRLLARNGSITLDHNTITAPTTLHLRKTVVNDNGGTALNTAWTLTATGASGSPTNLSGTTPVDSGVIFKPDTYTLAESGGPSGYTSSTYSCVKNGGAAVISNLITLAAGDDATCTITNNDIAPQLTVTKVVINDNGGTKIISDFPLFINGMSVISGIASTTSTGSYIVSEISDSGYTTAITGSCAANGTVTLAPGDIKACTITNDDIAQPSSGGGSVIAVPLVPPLIDVVKVPSPLALPAGPGFVTYNYTLRNIGTVPVTNITMVDDSCSPINFVSGDINTDAKLDVSETWTYRCSTTLSTTHTNTVVVTGWANGISATDIANATVVVGVTTVPPLIHITKIPNPLALVAGGGAVTYTKRVTNPGTVALSNVKVTDDKCSALSYLSGDTNSNFKLDTTETWVYTCRTNLTKTTTNTAIVTGEANGLTARDFAIATVVVATAVPTATTVPKLPNTGISPMESATLWPIIAVSILAILFIFYVVRKKQIIY